MNRCAMLAVTWMLALPAFVWSEEGTAPVKGETFETFISVPALEDGPGSENREGIVEGFQALKKGNLAAAEQAFKAAQAKYQALCKDEKKTYVSLANKKEFETYKKEHPGQDAVWIDWGYLECTQMLAFVSTSKKDFKGALAYLAAEEKIAPYSSAVHNERGFILNQMGKCKEALAEYTKGKELGEKFEASRVELPISMRGMGFALIELGRLDEAQQIFEASLKIDPNNRIAKNELLYIEEVREKLKQQGEAKTAP